MLTRVVMLLIGIGALLVGMPAFVLGILTLGIGIPMLFFGSLRRSFAGSGGDGGTTPQSDPSRRRLLRSMAMGGAAAATLPVAAIAAADDGEDEPDPARGPDGRIRQWSMVIDLRRCDGCQSQGTPPQCSLACIEGHKVPPPMEWIEIFEKEVHGGGTQFVPMPCQQCQNPPCVNVCPVTATFSTQEGPVLIDQDRCIGCRMCMAACPYDRRFFNWGDAPVPPEAALAHYHPEHQVGAPVGTVMKCDFCPDMARAGSLPMCAAGCPNNAIYYGDLEEDIATNGVELIKISDFIAENHSYRIKEELGTEPRVHYIPGHGELVGRNRETEGRRDTVWPWAERAEGSVGWSR